MTWNYRMIRVPDGEEWSYRIHEVYYGEDGKPESWSAEPVYAAGESPVALMEDLALMEKAFHLPAFEVKSDGKDERLVEVDINRATGKDK